MPTSMKPEQEMLRNIKDDNGMDAAITHLNEA